MANPILNDRFGNDKNWENSSQIYNAELVTEADVMTVQGTVNKLALSFVLLLAGAYVSWTQFFAGMTDKVNLILTFGAIAAFVIAMVIIFAKKTAGFLVPVYALCEGLVLGGVSAIFEQAYSGIVFQAVLSTFAAFGVMLFLYKARIIRYTQRFNTVLLTALLSIFVIYGIQFVASFFGRSIPLIFSNGIVGIGFSVFVVIVAALCFISDFNFIESASERVLPKYYEWYGAFGVLLTFVWLYMEILRLLAKINSRR